MAELTREQWHRVKSLFERATDLAPAQRQALLNAECDGDTTVRIEVESLLASDGGEPNEFLEEPASRPGDGERIDALIGATVGRFRLLGRIGSGGMGIVYLAERADEAFDQRVAVKVLKRGMDTEDIVRRFRLERQALAHLEHPNIARLVDGGSTDDGRPYLVMEHVEGIPIDTYCVEHGLDIPARLGLLRKVCAATQHAHEHLMVHRDLKPANILVSDTGEPKLLDFGVAKLLAPAGGPQSANLTATGHRLLTPRYASPEQFRSGATTTATDVYALGVILYELLAGRPPFDPGKTGTALERAICEDDPPRPSTAVGTDATDTGTRQWRRRLQGDLDTIVLKAMEKDPRRRYRSVADLDDDLRRFLEDAPIAARPPSARYRLRKFVHRRRTTLRSAAIGIAASLVLSLALVTWFVWMPAASASALRQARTIVLGPEPQSAMYTTLFFRGFPDPAGRYLEVERSTPRSALARAETLYDRAVALAPLDGALRRERGVIRTARRFREAGIGAVITDDLVADLAPEVADLVLTSDRERLPSADPAVLRELGLVLLLTAPSSVAVEALQAYEAAADPDPFIEGLLGQLYLILDHPELAYPRIRRAYDAFPASRSITLALAEAAIGTGDLSRVQRLLDHAARLPDPDRFDRLARVRAWFLAATGDRERADAMYAVAMRPGVEGINQRSRNPITCHQYARVLEAEGDLDGAITFAAYVAYRKWEGIGEPLCDYVAWVDRWVAGWSPDERARRLRNAADDRDEVVMAPDVIRGGLASRLRLYLRARRDLLDPARPRRIAVSADEATRFAAERRGWAEPTDATRLADLIAAEDVVFWEAVGDLPDDALEPLRDAWVREDTAAAATAIAALTGGLKRADARSRSVPSSTEIHKLTVPDPDLTVSTVSVSGDVVFVGAVSTEGPSGATFVYRLDAGSWRQEQKLTAFANRPGERRPRLGVTAEENDYFGNAVSISGDIAIVGALGTECVTGSAFIYSFVNGAWTPQQRITATDGAVFHRFGLSVSVSGDAAIVGSPGYSQTKFGSAYVYRFASGFWRQEQKLTASDATTSFGSSVAIEGDVAFVGATHAAGFSGSAYVYRYDEGTWKQEQTLIPPDLDVHDYFGTSISISGDVAIVGAPAERRMGSAYLFRFAAGRWSQVRKLTAPDGGRRDYFGRAVAIDGDRAIVGAHGIAGGTGAAYVYRRVSDRWTLQHKLTASAGGPGDYLGGTVALAGDRAVVVGGGAAYVFDLDDD